jgi:hypothetical protein
MKEVVKPMYMFPNKPIKYHGAGMTKKLQKLRDKDPYASGGQPQIGGFGLRSSRTTMPR